MGLLDKMAARRAEKGFVQPPFWTQDGLTDASSSAFWSPMTGAHERIEPNYASFIESAYKASPPVFSVIRFRQSVLSEARFQWRQFVKGRPGELFGSSELALLENPWPGGTTGNLLTRMEVTASLAGNYYATTADDRGRLGRAASGPSKRIVHMRPDWVTIVIDSESGDPNALDARIVGYIYKPPPPGSGIRDTEPVTLLPEEVCHFAPLTDPGARFRGMSWLTPLVEEVRSDKAATLHKARFFQNGAPQPYDAGVLTPDGWVEMGDIQVGDRVFGPDGKPRAVTAIYPQGIRDIYRVTFSSGATTECTDDHLWTVANAYDRKRGVTRTLPLSSLIDSGIRYDSGPYKWSVPLVDPLEFDDDGTELPVHPYLLGSLLGDGSFRSNGQGSGGVTLACHLDDADEQLGLISPLLPDGVSIGRRDRVCTEFRFRGPGAPRVNPFTTAIRNLGLFDVPGYEKFIPEPYLRASVTDRVALLQGLIDTDGSVERRQPNTVRFDSTSERLARQLADLAASLGAVVSVRPAKKTGQGQRQQWRVTISRLPEWITPCRLARKAALYSATFRGGRWRYIQSVEYVGRKPAKCIAVDSVDHLYVTDNFILTHNTPNMAVVLGTDVGPSEFTEYVAAFKAAHAGADNAWKTLFLAGGADVRPLAHSFSEMDFKPLQGLAETRVAAAAGVHPSVCGFSEGLAGSSLNAGNFNAAARLVANTTLRPWWRDAAASLSTLVTAPSGGAQLWYDDRDIAFLREDATDQAQIQQMNASALSSMIAAGFKPDAAVQYLQSGDLGRLIGGHTGLYSVQLLPPNVSGPAAPGAASPDPDPGPSPTP